MLDGLRMYDSDYGDSSDDSRLDVVPNASSSDDSTDNAGPVSVVVFHAKKVWFFPSNDLSFFCLVGCSCILEYQICWIFVQMLFKKLFNIFALKSCGSYARFSNFSNFMHANWFSPFLDWIHPIFICFIEYSAFLFVCNINAASPQVLCSNHAGLTTGSPISSILRMQIDSHHFRNGFIPSSFIL